jgi:hypothetical protein
LVPREMLSSSPDAERLFMTGAVEGVVSLRNRSWTSGVDWRV